MRKLLLINSFFFIIFSLYADNIPEWVNYYKKSGTIKDFKNSYFGVGTSIRSQDGADKIALREFGMSIETRVQSELKSFLQEKNGKVTDDLSKKINISSNVGLKGISITGRFFDGETYFSIIQYNKEDYNKMLRDEVKRELERQQIELEKRIGKNKITEKKKQESIRKKKESEIIKENVSQMKKELILKMRNKYPDFFKSSPPYKAISFRNGQLIPQQKQINFRAGLFPISFEDIFLAYKLWLFELSMTSSFDENKYNQQEVQIKYQILPYSGKFYKLSAAFGFTGYKTGIINSNFLEANNLISPFIAGNVTLPNLYFSFASIYADLGKTSFAINNYLFYKHLKDKISVILEVNFIYDKHLRNKFNNTIVFQPAIIFKTTKNLSTTFSYEDYELCKVSVEIGF